MPDACKQNLQQIVQLLPCRLVSVFLAIIGQILTAQCVFCGTTCAWSHSCHKGHTWILFGHKLISCLAAVSFCHGWRTSTATGWSLRSASLATPWPSKFPEVLSTLVQRRWCTGDGIRALPFTMPWCFFWMEMFFCEKVRVCSSYCKIHKTILL